mgnify:CR=1 FL=1
MAKGATKTAPKAKPKRADIRAFFKPGPASPQESPPPKPKAKIKPRPTPKPVDVKGKRKATVLDDDDSDLEIIEPTPAPAPLKKRAAAEPIAGPSRIAVKLELDLELLEPESVVLGSGAGRRASTVGAWAADDGPKSSRPSSRMQLDEQPEAAEPEPKAEVELEDGDLEPGDDERAIEPGRELVEDRAGSGTDWGDDDETAGGDESGAVLSEGGDERDWGDDDPPGGDDGGWGPDSFNAQQDDEAQDLERDGSVLLEVEEPIQGSSKDLEAPPVGSQPSCPVCACVLASLPEQVRGPAVSANERESKVLNSRNVLPNCSNANCTSTSASTARLPRAPHPRSWAPRSLPRSPPLARLPPSPNPPILLQNPASHSRRCPSPRFRTRSRRSWSATASRSSGRRQRRATTSRVACPRARSGLCPSTSGANFDEIGFRTLAHATRAGLTACRSRLMRSSTARLRAARHTSSAMRTVSLGGVSESNES